MVKRVAEGVAECAFCFGTDFDAGTFRSFPRKRKSRVFNEVVA